MHKTIKLILAVVFSALSIYAFAAVEPSSHKKAQKKEASQAKQADEASKAESAPKTEKTDDAQMTPAEASKVSAIKEKLKSVYPQINVDSLKPSPVAGWHQMTSGTLVMYVSDDAHYLFYGELLDLNQDESQRNVTENVRREFRIGFLKTLKVEDMIVYPAKKQPAKATILAFIDSDCTHCRRLHEESPQLAERGIELHYLAFPRAGVGSETYNNMVSAWCSEDRNKALNSLMKGEKIPAKECANPVANQFLLGQKLGISGTPTLVFEDGTIIPGYMPADKLATEAVKHKQSASK